MFGPVSLLVLGLAATQALLVVNQTSSLRLENQNGQKNLFMGLADAMALDTDQNLLYVVGGNTDMLNVVDVSLKDNLRLYFQKHFSAVSDGIPLSVAVCRFSGLNQLARLAIGFANREKTYEGHIEVFDLLTAGASNPQLVIRENIAVQPDPTSLKFNEECDQIVVACAGEAGGRNDPKVFVDPVGHVDLVQLNPLGGYTVHRLNFAANNSAVRQVYNNYNDINQGLANDLEPEIIAFGSNNTAYVICQENNAVGGFDTTRVNTDIQLYDMGTKDFSMYDVDTSDADLNDSPNGDGINLQRRNIQAFYQPGDMKVFQHNGEDYLLTADTGAQKQFTAVEQGVDFTESKRGRQFDANELNTNALGSATVDDLRDNARLGRLYLSNLQQKLDGFDDVITNTYTSLRMYGARGFSIWRPSDLSQTYHSGGEFEYQMKETYPSLFNGDIVGGNRVPTQDTDTRSDDKGPEPTAIATGMVNGKRIAVIGSGRTGTLFVYIIEPDSANLPVGRFQSIFRPGDANDNWTNLWNQDRAGHPRITAMEIIGTDLYVLGGATGTVNVYSLNDI
ncbi:hypothetical protein LOTGIDRAFT_228108 [Lottia gigantea]|uniref:Choice-of-anchor I domain-containing protein n=1 Tax=Lottia gigantea TaxID=225164 RepID=V4AN42_LOTGI|nr:hypothetical protein LOTGIDRAFT_228108 [Lottia gigantea]ESP05584.1 hypothetical protein LOTGIDRAFT_228108 [Lottia gigantea]